MENNLSQFGYGFQTKILSSLIDDRNFIITHLDLIDIKYFDSKALQWLVEKTLFYFREYNLLPTLEVFKVQLASITNELFRSEVVKTLKDAWENKNSTDLEFVKNKFFEFCVSQEYIKAVFSSVEDIKLGKTDDIRGRFDRISKIGLNDKMGMNYFLDIEKRYSENERKLQIPTGWPVIDDLLQGGLPLGKFGLIMGDKGSGKSFSLVHLGAAALKAGYNVIHYTLELDENYVGYRYDSCLTGINLDDLKYNVSDIKKRLQKYSNQLIIKEFPTKSVTLNGIRSHTERTKLLGINPTIVLIDYLDLLKIDYRSDARKDEQLEELYERFRGYCGEMDVAGWSVTQNNRSGSEKDVVEAESVAGSYAKGFVADFWMSLSRRTKDKVSNTARFKIIKNRFGPDGMVLPSKFITEKSLIEIYHEKSESGKKANNQMVSDEEFLVKQYGSKQFELLMNSNRKEPNDLF